LDRFDFALPAAQARRDAAKSAWVEHIAAHGC
jgi:hypothetical protein